MAILTSKPKIEIEGTQTTKELTENYITPTPNAIA